MKITSNPVEAILRYSLTSWEFNMTLILETSTFLYESVRFGTMTEKKRIIGYQISLKRSKNQFLSLT